MESGEFRVVSEELGVVQLFSCSVRRFEVEINKKNSLLCSFFAFFASNRQTKQNHERKREGFFRCRQKVQEHGVHCVLPLLEGPGRGERPVSRDAHQPMARLRLV